MTPYRWYAAHPKGQHKTVYPQKMVDRVRAGMVDLRDLHGNDACWPWPTLGGHGYGSVTVYVDGDSRQAGVHRVALLAAGVTLDPELIVDHICCNRRCVNPRHLQQVTWADNVRLGYERRRAANTAPYALTAADNDGQGSITG